MKEFKITSQSQITPVTQKVAAMIRDALSGGRVKKAYLTVSRESRSKPQNAKIHALISDIAKTVELDRFYDLDHWKAVLIDAFEQELESIGESLPKPSRVFLSLDGKRAVSERASSKDFDKEIAGKFIEFLYCFGSEHGATFSEESISAVNEVRSG